MLLFICFHLTMVEVGGQQLPLYFVMFMLRTHLTPHVVCFNAKQGKATTAPFTSFFLGTKPTNILGRVMHVPFVNVFLATTSLVACPFCLSTCSNRQKGLISPFVFFFLHVTTNVEEQYAFQVFLFFLQKHLIWSIGGLILVV